MLQVDDASDSSSEDHFHSIFQNPLSSYTVGINRIMIEMEVDSGAERLTVPK